MDVDFTIKELLEKTFSAAINAGTVIMEVYSDYNLEIKYKADNSPLTIADERAHTEIVRILELTKLPILSEEGKTIPFEERKNWKTFWLVDPLDGTKEFVKKNDEFTVNLALIHDSIPVIGVIYVPVSRTMYWCDSKSSFKADILPDKTFTNTRKLPYVEEKKDFVVVGSRSHMSKETEEYINEIDTRRKEVQTVSKGSSLKICLVAEGAADIYPRLAPTMEWDTAAGHAIAKCAGKEIYTFDSNQPLSYNKENLLNPWFVVK